MKIKEKHADRFVKTNKFPPLYGTKCYLAGFDKAAQLAQEFMVNSRHDKKYSEVEFHKALSLVIEDIKDIGEDESL